MPNGEKMSEARLEKLCEELDFLDICELVLYFADHRTTSMISWKHARAHVIVNPRRRRSKTAESEANRAPPTTGEQPR